MMHEPQVDLQGARILLVDDQPANLEVLCELLEAEGYEISLAPRGEIALKIVGEAEGRPDLILLDVMMPEMDGYEVCRRLKADAATRDIPVIFIAGEMGREAPEIAPEGLQRLESYAFPGNVRELKNIIERALMESRGGEIGPEHLHFQPEAGAAPSRETVDVAEDEVPLNLEEAELWLIKRAIGRTGGNISEAARLLGTNRTRIYRALKLAPVTGRRSIRSRQIRNIPCAGSSTTSPPFPHWQAAPAV